MTISTSCQAEIAAAIEKERPFKEAFARRRQSEFSASLKTLAGQQTALGIERKTHLPSVAGAAIYADSLSNDPLTSSRSTQQ